MNPAEQTGRRTSLLIYDSRVLLLLELILRCASTSDVMLSVFWRFSPPPLLCLPPVPCAPSLQAPEVGPARPAPPCSRSVAPDWRGLETNQPMRAATIKGGNPFNPEARPREGRPRHGAPV